MADVDHHAIGGNLAVVVDAELPPYVPSRGYIHGQYDGLGRTTDATAIWAVKR